MGRTILVVDDEARIVKLVRDYLERAGFDVLAAHDGETALTLARLEQPDLVVLDMMLPQRSGFLVLEKIKGRADSPLVVMITANEGRRGGKSIPLKKITDRAVEGMEMVAANPAQAAAWMAEGFGMPAL